MRQELELIKEKVKEMAKTETGVTLEILKLIDILAKSIESVDNRVSWQGASGHGY